MGPGEATASGESGLAVGEKVEVRLVDVSVERGSIDFEIA